MPYFMSIDTFEVVFRKHKYNSEVLDGSIIEIADDEPCLLLGHNPTKSFDYECFIKKELTPEQGVDTINKLPSERKNDGTLYYKLVPKIKYIEYLDNFNLKERKSLNQYQPLPTSKNIIKEIKPDIKKVSGLTNTNTDSTPDKITQKSDKEATPVAGFTGVKLMRDGEKSII